MSDCPVCKQEYTIYGCQCLKVGEPVPLDGSITSYKGLEEISKITMREAALSETLTPKINEIIERVNLLTNFLIRRKNKEVKNV